MIDKVLCQQKLIKYTEWCLHMTLTYIPLMHIKKIYCFFYWQASEKELNRQLNREKEKNRNCEQRIKHLREENEKLRLAVPFDDSTLLSSKEMYDIPYGSHSKDKAETLKVSVDLVFVIFYLKI